ncbi:uncharacterized protein LOC128366039 [Scomber scombrus]|uniref:Uncharacterized protein LOC128366039 n=2 Tax=Scomber scombrus TaxID=13677 RepID=A0AAV1N3D9_SCOSC
MQVISDERSLWMYTLLFTSLQLWARLSASTSTSSPSLPAPKLDIHLRTGDSVVLICEVPGGYTGVQFMLFQYKDKVDSQELLSGAQHALFNIRVKEGDPHELFCCLYKDQQNRYSMFSPYLRIEILKAATPTRSIPSFPPPSLSVEPSAGVVKRGDTLSFSCSVPAPIPQSQSSSKNKQVSFFLLKTTKGTGTTSIIHQPQASLVSNTKPQPGVFNVGPVTGGEGGEYTCIYQITKKRGLVNSTVSNTVQVTIIDMLPAPTLVLQQHTEVWHLLCVGSPAYPGAEFSLYQADNDLPVARHYAKWFHHKAVFPVPVQDTSVASYQCQYSVLLRGEWSYSERSYPLALTGGVPPPTSTALSGVDWPLALGSFSAAVLFLSSAALVVMLACRKGADKLPYMTSPLTFC